VVGQLGDNGGVEDALRRPAAFRDSVRASYDHATLLRTALQRSFVVMRERDLGRLQERVLADARELLDASAARFHALDAEGCWQVACAAAADELPPLATRMEAELLPRALAAGKSLLSTHPQLDNELAELSEWCAAALITTHLLLLRAHQRTVGAVGVHWVGAPRPADYEPRSVFYAYWDNAGLAVATALERTRAEADLAALRRRAYTDLLTGLPNQQALDDELRRHARTFPLGVLAVDFDGMREANIAFRSYSEGGDVLIRAVGAALAANTIPPEFVARMHTAGDEFAILLPGADESTTQKRAAEIELALDTLAVPPTHRSVYHGASIGTANRNSPETPGQTLGRAIKAMSERKQTRGARDGR
jgi:diguanylate cyclase (GGDEF)-like protein